MREKPSLLIVEHAQIVAFHMERLSERQVVKRLQCNKSFIHLAIEKLKKHKIYDDIKKLVDPIKIKKMIMPSDELSCNPPTLVKYMAIC